MELLSPAGSMDSVKAAIANGADAVFLGPKLFNARRLAGNFSETELGEAVGLCHLHGVKAYLTLNTLVRNEEIGQWFRVLEKAYLAGADGAIIQEVAFAKLIKKAFPGLELHASTQASFMNWHGISNFQEFDLVVLAREMTREEIKETRIKVRQKLEMFVHGHLCVSYSGQCLISSLIGSRSGNRGVCASSCRKRYNGKGYLISPRDLNMADNVAELAKIGIDTLKIEGRMKSPEYVAVTTRAYRRQIDDAMKGRSRPLTKEETDSLRMGFNRDFTPGFFSAPQIIDERMPMNRGISLGEVIKGRLTLKHAIELHDGIGFWRGTGILEGGILRGMTVNGKKAERAKEGDTAILHMKEFREGAKVFLTSQNKGKDIFALPKIKVTVDATGSPGENLTVQAKNGSWAAASAIALQHPKQHALGIAALAEEFARSKDIKWHIEKLALKPSFLPKSTLKALRREMEEKARQACGPNREKHPYTLPYYEDARFAKPRLIVKAYSLESLREADACGVDAIYYDVFSSNVKEAKSLCKKAAFFLDTPAILSDSDIVRIESRIADIKPDGIAIGNWGLLNLKFSGERHGKYSLNTFNDISMSMLLDKGITPTFSVELSAKQLSQFRIKKGIYYAHGRIPVMHFKGIRPERLLTDEKGYAFPLRKMNGSTEMLYSRPIATYEGVLHLMDMGINHFLLDLEKDTTTIITAYQKILAGAKPDTSMLKKGTTNKTFRVGVG